MRWEAFAFTSCPAQAAETQESGDSSEDEVDGFCIRTESSTQAAEPSRDVVGSISVHTSSPAQAAKRAAAEPSEDELELALSYLHLHTRFHSRFEVVKYAFNLCVAGVAR